MDKIKKLLVGLILFRIITIPSDTPNIIPMTTPTLTITPPPIGSNLGLRYIIIDDTTILYYLF